MNQEQPPIERDKQELLRRYLLGQLAEEDVERVENCLLEDPACAEEFDIVAAELADEYAAGRLSVRESEHLRRHLFAADGRGDDVRFAAALRRYVDDPPAPEVPWWRRQSFYLPVAASVLLVLGLGVWRAFFYESDLDRGLAALRRAYASRRPVEARLSGWDAYAGLHLRGEGQQADRAEREYAFSLIYRTTKERPSAEAFRALGEYYLAERRPDEAIAEFERALALAPQDARVHSDLGAAFLEKWKLDAEKQDRDERPAVLAKGLEHVKAALELDAALAEALFNRALLLQHMGMPRPAAEAWREYLKRDQASPWADEARANLREIEGQGQGSRGAARPLDEFLSAYAAQDEARVWEVVGRHYDSAGNAVAADLLDAYLAADARGEAGEARDKLEALSYLGRLLSRRAGDDYTADLARFYARSDPPLRRDLAAARERLRRGYQLYLQLDWAGARAHYAEAKRVFAAAGDECEAVFADYLAGLCYMFDGRKAESVFGPLLALAGERGYAWLLSQSLHRAAMIRLQDNQYSAGFQYARRALDAAERVGDVNGTVRILTQLADAYEQLNDRESSLRFAGRGLSLASAASPDRVWGVYTVVALNLSSLGLHRAAVEYQQEALRLALQTGRPMYVARSESYLGMTYASLSRYPEALAHTSRAFEAGERIGGEGGRELKANASLYAAEIHRRLGRHEQAVAAYDAAIGHYAEQDFSYFSYAARKGKLLALLAAGGDESVEPELRAVLGLFEQYRLGVLSERQRNTFFDVEQGVYDRVIGFAHARKNDAALAFDYSELSRARSLLDAMQRGARLAEPGDASDLSFAAVAPPMTLAAVREAMPADSRIVQYSALEDKLVIWVVTREGVSTETVFVGYAALSEKVRDYLRLLNRPAADGDEALRRAAAELHAVLVKPVEHLLGGGRLLCVVADKILHRLPFNALRSASGPYLVEQHRLVMSPSATVFVHCSAEAARRARLRGEGQDGERLLAVGDPSFDRAAFPDLPPLPSAGREAKLISRYYASSRLLLDRAAREATVKDDIAGADVAHFALHNVVDEQASTRSGLVLAKEARGAGDGAEGAAEDGVWRAAEIYRTELPRTRLVVLSACRTGVEEQFGVEGTAGVARPFIAAGVPVVVASLWAVDSDSSTQLMIDFHEKRARHKLHTAEALRQAQLNLLRGPDTRYRHPHYWAAFAAVGGHAPF